LRPSLSVRKACKMTKLGFYIFQKIQCSRIIRIRRYPTFMHIADFGEVAYLFEMFQFVNDGGTDFRCAVDRTENARIFGTENFCDLEKRIGNGLSRYLYTLQHIAFGGNRRFRPVE
jgi:hypothetical protein